MLSSEMSKEKESKLFSTQSITLKNVSLRRTREKRKLSFSSLKSR